MLLDIFKKVETDEVNISIFCKTKKLNSDPTMEASLKNIERFLQTANKKQKTISRVNYLMEIHTSHSEMKLLSLLYQVNREQWNLLLVSIIVAVVVAPRE